MQIAMMEEYRQTNHARFNEAMRRIGWSQNELVRRLGIAEGTSRQWASGRKDCQDEVLAWLDHIGAALDAAIKANPMPEGWSREQHDAMLAAERALKDAATKEFLEDF